MAEAVQVGVGQRALAVAGGVRARVGSMPSGRRNWLLGGGAVVLAAALGMVWYGGRPDWRVLFSGLDGKDVQQVGQELGAAGIAFQMTPDGTGVEVPADALDKARMEVAAKGMPQTGRMGFELFDKPNWVGSEFDERVNYQRAMEGELEHTIGTLGMVRSARVHLVLPQASLFLSQEKQAKASVVLKLKRGLEPEQTESIRNLVAGAVENLNPEQVTLVDADGRANLQRGSGHGAVGADEAREIETKLVAMLEPLAGAGNVRATVNVTYAAGTEERTDEVYDPAATATLTTQKSEQTSGGGKTASGVPGTASNSPAAAASGAVQGSAKAAAPGTPPLLQGGGKDGLPVFPQGGGAGQSMREESASYAVTRHVVHSEEGPGRVKRLTAAVIVNDRLVADASGKVLKTMWKPRSGDEMHRLESLAKAAVGYDEARGDQVAMENVSFSSNVAEAEATAGVGKVLDQAKGLLGAQQGLVRTAVMGVLGLLLVMFVLRPVAGQVVASLREPMLLQAAAGSEAEGVNVLRDAAHRAAMEAASRGEWGGPERSQGREGTEILQQVSTQIKRDPQQSTRLLEAWIAGDGEGN